MGRGLWVAAAVALCTVRTAALGAGVWLVLSSSGPAQAVGRRSVAELLFSVEINTKSWLSFLRYVKVLR